MSRPGLWAMNVIVWLACTAQPITAPVSAWIPLGMSSERMGVPSALSFSTRAACAPASGRVSPMPNRPSTARPKRRSAGMSSRSVSPTASHLSSAFRASLGSLSRSPADTTVTRKNARLRCVATSKASPPLLPGPATTSTSLVLSPQSSRAYSAAAAPARSMSVGVGDAAPASPSSLRMADVV